MEIEYNRDIRYSRMRIISRCRLEPTEEFMLLKNRIYGLTPVTIRKEDEKSVFFYDITGKQSLESLLENETADERMLLLLFSGITGLLDRLEKYLLCGIYLLLIPECIFWDYRTEEFCFCYCPEHEQDLPEAFRKLVEYLLAKTNYKDENAVDIIYNVYEETLKEGYSLKNIKESLHLWQGTEQAGEKLQEDVRQRHEEKTGKRRYLETKDSDTEKKETDNRKVYEEAQKTDKQNATVTKFLQADFWKSKILNILNKKVSPSFPMPGKRKKETEPIVFEPEEEEIKISRPTVLLAERKREAYGILKYEGVNRQTDLNMERFPYLIGSALSCDGVISLNTISRKHAKITKIDQIYFIEDLNSLNGTVVGGKLLQYKQKVSLEINEVVEFGGEPYRFL